MIIYIINFSHFFIINLGGYTQVSCIHKILVIELIPVFELCLLNEKVVD